MKGYDIPEELVEQILLELPIKSLVRFKSVCKSWNSLISDRRFVNKHLQINTNKSNSSPKPSMVFGWDRVERSAERGTEKLVFQCTIVSGDGDNYSISRPCDNRKQLYVNSSHCNGILCLVSNPWKPQLQVVFYNPALREHRPLHMSPNTSRGHHFWGHGFGYDHKADDYKFIKILWLTKKVSVAHVYSLRSSQWRKIKIGFDCKICKYSKGVYLKGHYYWVDVYVGNNIYSNPKILSFDISEERFSIVDLPPNYNQSCYLNKCDEWLVCFVLSENRDRYEMWMMMDGGDWIKHRTITGLNNELPLAIWKDDEWFLEGPNGSFYTYNITTGKRTMLPCFDFLLSRSFYFASVYVESLVSVKNHVKY